MTVWAFGKGRGWGCTYSPDSLCTISGVSVCLHHFGGRFYLSVKSLYDSKKVKNYLSIGKLECHAGAYFSEKSWI